MSKIYFVESELYPRDYFESEVARNEMAGTLLFPCYARNKLV